ncbi:MAG: hypothetical protein QOG64_2863, partial [Acidimicrobiaceae bacterium]|nr:hypothetical protein [Acidimicrobiaceae bacterium]
MEVRNLLHTVRHRVTAELVRVRETERAWRARTAVVVSTVAALALVGVSMPQPTLAARRTPAGAAPVASGALIGSREPGRIGAEASAIRLVAALGGLPVAAGSRLADRPLAGLFDLA